ncbi:MAG: hypothetical protein VXW85_00525 [Candidatus Thermoplasmatota archaeon]|nr:hypothetical protein [Candidatus Thermoplasmatota archaeon]MEC7273420.1 hypothetical protein [Candidatus Thermoplasmatota archaeon]
METNMAKEWNGDVVRLQLNNHGEFSFLFWDGGVEVYDLGNPGKEMLFQQNDDRLLEWIVGRMSVAFMKSEHWELMEQLDEDQQIYVATGLSRNKSEDADELHAAIEDIRHPIYAYVRQHLLHHWNLYGFKRAMVRENYSHQKLLNIRTEVETNFVRFRKFRMIDENTPEMTEELKNELEIWAVDHPEHVPI